MKALGKKIENMFAAITSPKRVNSRPHWNTYGMKRAEAVDRVVQTVRPERNSSAGFAEEVGVCGIARLSSCVIMYQ